MEHQSPYTIDVPVTDIPSFIFSGGDASSREAPQYFDAECPSRNFSLKDAETMVRQVGKGLQDVGLAPGDRVLLIAGNNLHFPVLLWGTIAGGFIFTGCTPTASAQELAYQLKDSGAKMILAGPDAISTALEGAAMAGISANMVFSFCSVHESSKPQPRNLRPWTSFWALENEALNWQWKRITTLEEAQSSTAIINYSSGTTGLPKGVEITHYNLISNSMQVLHKLRLVAPSAAGKARRQQLDRSGDRWLAPIPMYHAYGQAYFCVNAARTGAKVYIMAKFNLRQYLLYMDIYRITYMASVPTIMVMLSKDASASAYNFSAVEQVVTGSAPLGKDIGALIAKRFLNPGVLVKQGWGMTECTCSATGFAPDDVDDGTSVGWLNANVSGKIVPIEGRDFEGHGTNVVGEIWISGPNIMKGYFNKPEETQETIVHENGRRWLRTGDIGYFSSDGLLYIVDRLKELIKVKGLQVAPAELEAVLLLHPGVQDAAVGVVKKQGQEHPKGYIVRKSSSVTAEELEKWIRGRCSPHKWLTGGIAFVEIIPRTASGKVKRRELSAAGSTGSKL